MESIIKAREAISANVQFYTDMWSTILFWLSLPVAFFFEDIGRFMMGAAWILLAIRLVNNRWSLGRWLG